MRENRLQRVVTPLVATLVALAVVAPTAPAGAEMPDAITTRRALGLLFIGGSAALTVQGFDYRSQADDFYDAYKVAVDPTEIDRLYQRTTNRDVKAQVSWALAAAFGISGLRLMLTGNDDVGEYARHPATPGSGKEGHLAQVADLSGPRLTLSPIADGRQVGLQLSRHFF